MAANWQIIVLIYRKMNKEEICLPITILIERSRGHDLPPFKRPQGIVELNALLLFHPRLGPLFFLRRQNNIIVYEIIGMLH